MPNRAATAIKKFWCTTAATTVVLLLTGTAPVAAQEPVPSPTPLTLPAAIQEALSANPTAAAAYQELQQARARTEQVRAQQRVQISLTSSASGSNVAVIQPPPAHQTFGVVQNTLTIPIPFGPKGRYGIAQSEQQFRAATATWESARLALVSQVVTAYYDILRKQALLEVARQTLDQANRQFAESQKRFRAGDVPELDTIRAQVPVSTAEAGVYQAENDLLIARQALNALLGRPLTDPVAVADVAPPANGSAETPFSYTAEEARARALTANPDIRAAEATVRAGEAALASARRYREPSLSLQVSDIRSNDQTAFSREDTVQASLTIPLGDGGLGKAQVREAEAALAQSRLLATAARRTAEVTLNSAYLNAQSARRQAQAAATARDIARISYDKTLRGYTTGLFPLTDVLAAQAALRQAQVAYIQTLYDASAAGATLQNVVAGSAALPAPATPGTVVPPTGINPAGPGAPGANPNGTPPPTAPSPPGSGTP